MTLYDFANTHPFLAVFFALLAAGTVVTVVAMFVTWRIARPVKYTAADRGALTQASALLRFDSRGHATGTTGYDHRVEAAEKLEGMAAR